MRRKKSISITKLLKKEYPDVQPSLRFDTVLQLLVATILSAQCTDKRVNRVTRTLFKKYTNVSAYARASIEVFQEDIRSTGFYRNKAKNIIRAAQVIKEKYNGKVPNTMDELLTLPGVARKTANIVLHHGFNIVAGIAVDTHVMRLSQRIGLTCSENPKAIELDLMKLFLRAEWGDINGLFIYHGRAICQARKPKCFECVLAALCDYYMKHASAVKKKG